MPASSALHGEGAAVPFVHNPHNPVRHYPIPGDPPGVYAGLKPDDRWCTCQLKCAGGHVRHKNTYTNHAKFRAEDLRNANWWKRDTSPTDSESPRFSSRGQKRRASDASTAAYDDMDEDQPGRPRDVCGREAVKRRRGAVRHIFREIGCAR
jgi:hypothetical protein